MTQHTPTPWVANGRWIGVQNHKSCIGQCYDQNGNLVTDAPMAIANAEFIVRAVNNHQALVEALEYVFASGQPLLTSQAIAKMKAALAKAKGE